MRYEIKKMIDYYSMKLDKKQKEYDHWLELYHTKGEEAVNRVRMEVLHGQIRYISYFITELKYILKKYKYEE